MKPIKYQTYKRGQIVSVDFGKGVGNELSGIHFAIVLTKKDSNFNGVLTVIPLSSKSKRYYLPLKNMIFALVYSGTEEYLKRVARDFNRGIALKSQLLGVTDKLQENLDFYHSKIKQSYALIQNITTISKFRIKPFINEYDPLFHLLAPPLHMNKIDDEIKKYFTF
ncbi:hypothetical protein A4S06_05195 [Erysipelotrichaceae bacterium MTC7]|nr:hypothetical protein A4S06_05195 [Erysipelotrichaceae bacterium MTC7]